MFSNGYACREDDIAYLYMVSENMTRVMLASGGSFYVQEPYADVMAELTNE